MYNFRKTSLTLRSILLSSITLTMLSTTIMAETVKGRVFQDTNANDLYDADIDMVLANVTVTVTDENGTVTTAITKTNGVYVAVNVAIGIATIEVNESTLPGNKPLQVFGINPSTKNVQPGIINWAGKDGYIFAQMTATVCGYIFFDKNRNGIFNTGEAIPNVNIEIERSVTITNEEGQYCQSGVPIGKDYQPIHVDEVSILDQLSATYDVVRDFEYTDVPDSHPFRVSQPQVNVVFVNQINCGYKYYSAFKFTFGIRSSWKVLSLSS